MVYGIIIIGITSFVMVSLLQFVVSNFKLGFFAEPKEQSIQIAEAGVYFYRWYLGHNIEGKTMTTTQTNNFWNSAVGVDDNQDGDCEDSDSSPDNYDSDNDGDIDNDDSDGTEAYVSVYKDGSGNEVGYYSICVTKPTTYFSSELTIKVTGWTKNKPNIKKSVTARIRKPSLSEYVILTNKYTKFDSNSTIYGTIHGNEGFELDNATVDNIVYSSVEDYYNGASTVDGVNGTATFNAGKVFPVQRVDFQNAVSGIHAIRAQANSDSLLFEQDEDSKFGRYINLNSDGTINISTVTSYNEKTLEYFDTENPQIKVIPNNAVLYVEGNVWIDGTLGPNKKLTIVAYDEREGYSPNIYLGDDDLLYSDSNSVLGLIAENDIRFIKGSKNKLEIDASLFALKGAVGWIEPDGANWSTEFKSEITIFGSIASNKRINFKYSGSPDYGFSAQNIIFNAKLNETPPPMFPSKEMLEIDKWNEI